MDNSTISLPHPFFNTDYADIILRSSNGVEFHVHKAILAFASPYFKHMFLLPSKDGQSLLLDVPESDQIWESLLRLCYPVDAPSVNIDTIADLTAAAIKYDFPHAIKFMGKELRSYIGLNALDVFAIAYRLELLEEAGEAACSLHPKKPVTVGSHVYGFDSCFGMPTAPTRIEWPSTLEGKTFSPKIQSLLSAGDLFRLLKYLRTEPFPKVYSWDPVPAKSVPKPTTVLDLGYDTGDADLILKSFDDVEFRVHKVIIFLASANHLCNAPIESDTDELPAIRLSENGVTLGTLVSMCYPVVEVDFEDLSVFYEALKAAMKYEMKKIIQILQVRLTHYIERDPLRIYFTSIALGLKEEAIKASKVFALSSDDSANAYVREMEVVPAIAYHRLLKYRYQCRAATAKTWEDYNPRKSHSGDISMPVGTIALPVVEREWDMQQGNTRGGSHGKRCYHPPLQTPSGLMQESNRILRQIEDSIAKVDKITVYVGCAFDCKITGGTRVLLRYIHVE
jgi:BTB/POZ domain